MKYSPWFEYPVFHPSKIGWYDCKCGDRHWWNERLWLDKPSGEKVLASIFAIVCRGLARKTK